MAPAPIEQIVLALKTTLETLPNMSGRVYEYVPGTIEPPSITIIPGTFVPGDTKPAITYDSTMARGSDDYVFTLAVTVSRTHDRTAATELYRYLDPNSSNSYSVKAKLEADATLGGKVSFVHVQRVIQYGALVFNGNSFFGAQVIVEVTT